MDSYRPIPEWGVYFIEDATQRLKWVLVDTDFDRILCTDGPQLLTKLTANRLVAARRGINLGYQKVPLPTVWNKVLVPGV